MIDLLFVNATKGVLLGQISYFFHPPDVHSIVAHIFSKEGNSKFSQIGAKNKRVIIQIQAIDLFKP